jgi:hypothetical protein
VASNLSTIGFVFVDREEFAAAMTRLAGEAREHLGAAGGLYGIWRSRTGAEIWFQLTGEAGEGAREIVGLTPFFEGVSDVEVRVTERFQRPEDTPFEGAVTAWVSPGEEGEGAYPIVFDAVDFGAGQGSPDDGALARVRLSGFAREVKAFASPEAYDAAQMAEPRLAAQCFIPLGLFSSASSEPEASGSTPPSSSALLTGEVIEHRLLVNEVTGRSFHWMLVDGLDATFDVLADPEVVSGDIVPGGTVEVACLFFGRFLD